MKESKKEKLKAQCIASFNFFKRDAYGKDFPMVERLSMLARFINYAEKLFGKKWVKDNLIDEKNG